MSVAMLSRYEVAPDYAQEALKRAHAIKDVAIELGAEHMVMSQAIAGQYTGDWIAMTRAPDMATLEKIIRSLPENADYQAMIGSGKVKIAGRAFLDIPEGF